MRKSNVAFVAIAVCVLAAAPARPAPPETNVRVTLANFKFTPSTITLVHGQAYELDLSNTAGGGHNFVAPRFFAAARMSAADRARVGTKGVIEVGGGEEVALHLIAPPAGRYPVKCSHPFHSTFGMKGAIVVN